MSNRLKHAAGEFLRDQEAMFEFLAENGVRGFIASLRQPPAEANAQVYQLEPQPDQIYSVAA